jgi:hypothetical protein
MPVKLGLLKHRALMILDAGNGWSKKLAKCRKGDLRATALLLPSAF